MTYRIRDWDSLFENNRTRELKRMDWVPVPNKMDGAGYTALVDHPQGAAHLGAWLAILEIASRQKVRGTFPQDAAEIPQVLARISRLPAGLFSEVLARLVQLGWIEQLGEIPQEGAGIPQEGASRAHASALPFPSIPFNSIPSIPAKISEKSPAVLSSGFPEFWLRWGELTGRRQNEEAARRAWIGVVEPERTIDAMACLERYGASDEVKRGIVANPDKWLYAQAPDAWRGTWQSVKAEPDKLHAKRNEVLALTTLIGQSRERMTK